MLAVGLQSRSRKELEVFGWSWSRISNNTKSRSRIFFPTPDVQLDHFLNHTHKLGIPVEMVQFLFVETDFLLCTTISIDFKSQISFPLRSRKFWKVGIENFGKVGVGVGIGYFISDSATLVDRERQIASGVCADVGCCCIAQINFSQYRKLGVYQIMVDSCFSCTTKIGSLALVCKAVDFRLIRNLLVLDTSAKTDPRQSHEAHFVARRRAGLRRPGLPVSHRNGNPGNRGYDWTNA